MNLRQIETFYWAARLGSFIKAARHLNATPSAVSMRIQDLEAYLGLRLFDRSQRVVQLTPDGHRLLPLVERLVRAANDVDKASRNTGKPAGLVRLGVAEAVAVTWLPDFVARLRSRYPEVRVEVTVALSYLLEQALGRGELDLVLAPCNIPDTTFRSLSLGSVPFRWMCSPTMPRAPTRLLASEMADHTLITTSYDFQLRGATLEWVKRNGIRLDSALICNTFAISARLSMAGMGLALLPVPAYLNEIASGALRIVECDPEPGSLEHFVLRPQGRDEITLSALEGEALELSTFLRDGV